MFPGVPARAGSATSDPRSGWLPGPVSAVARGAVAGVSTPPVFVSVVDKSKRPALVERRQQLRSDAVVHHAKTAADNGFVVAEKHLTIRSDLAVTTQTLRAVQNFSYPNCRSLVHCSPDHLG